jgi:hypothetical protein
MTRYAWLGLSVGSWFLYFAAALTCPLLPDGSSYLLQGASILLGIVILSTVLLAGEHAPLSITARWACLSGGLLAMLLPWALNLQQPAVRSLATLGLVFIALPVGYWIGDRMEKATNLIPLAIAMSLADIYSVLQGPSRQVGEAIQAHQDALGARITQLGQSPTPQQIAGATAGLRAPLADFVVAHLPLAGLKATVPVLGIGDFIALAFIFRAVWVHRLHPRGVFIAALLSTLAALAVSLLTQRMIPALPFIALGVVGWLLCSSPRLRRLDRQEALLSIGVSVLFGALLLGKWLSGLLQRL